jgi:hypothetical protein
MQDAQLSSGSPSSQGERRFAGLRRRFPRQVNWLEARFSPEGYLGLHLTVGVLMLLSMAWLFGAIAEDVVAGDPIVLLDQKVAEWFNEHGTPAFFKMMTVITFFGCGEWVHSVAGIGAALLAWKRAWYRLLILLLTVPCGGLLNTLLKWAFQRHRPVLAHSAPHIGYLQLSQRSYDGRDPALRSGGGAGMSSRPHLAGTGVGRCRGELRDSPGCA